MLTSTVIAPGKIAMVMEDDELAIKAAIKTCINIDKKKARLVFIKNTLSLGEIYISESMIDEAIGIEGVDIMGSPEYLNFDKIQKSHRDFLN